MAYPFRRAVLAFPTENKLSYAQGVPQGDPVGIGHDPGVNGPCTDHGGDGCAPGACVAHGAPLTGNNSTCRRGIITSNVLNSFPLIM